MVYCLSFVVLNFEVFKMKNDRQIIPDLSPEIIFQTSRSGGKGGQNVNKVETAVTGFFKIDTSAIFSDEQKQLLKEKLSNRINAEGELFVKSQVHRTQLANKEEVIEKINAIAGDAPAK